jgi:hypothetical protein
MCRPQDLPPRAGAKREGSSEESEHGLMPVAGSHATMSTAGVHTTLTGHHVEQG